MRFPPACERALRRETLFARSFGSCRPRPEHDGRRSDSGACIPSAATTKRHDGLVCLDRSRFFCGSSALLLCRHDSIAAVRIRPSMCKVGVPGARRSRKLRELEEVRSPDPYGIPGRRTPKRTCRGDIMAPSLQGVSCTWVCASGKHGYILGRRVAERTATATAQVAAILGYS